MSRVVNQYLKSYGQEQRYIKYIYGSKTTIDMSLSPKRATV